jgi:hypothetical protein
LVLLEPWTAGAEESFLAACLETLTVEETDRVTQGFTFLANRLAAATLVKPGSVEEMREVLARARRTGAAPNLGLEYLVGLLEPPSNSIHLTTYAIKCILRPWLR